MNEEVLIIFKSIYHRNTERLSVSMARKLNCRCVTSEQAKSINLESYKVIGLGSGIYFTSNHPELCDIATRLVSTQKVFLFSTHGSPFLGKYHKKLKDILMNQNVTIVGEFSCRGYDCTGPFIIIGGGNKGRPNERDQENAARFVERLFPEYIKQTKESNNGKHVVIRNDECIKCRKCQEGCPMKVFRIRDEEIEVVNEEECIHCSLCTENCPAQAISVLHSWREAIAIAKRHAKKTSL